jgi:hypothetical protein
MPVARPQKLGGENKLTLPRKLCERKRARKEDSGKIIIFFSHLGLNFFGELSVSIFILPVGMEEAEALVIPDGP